MLFSSTKFVVICYRSNGKLTEIHCLMVPMARKLTWVGLAEFLVQTLEKNPFSCVFQLLESPGLLGLWHGSVTSKPVT